LVSSGEKGKYIAAEPSVSSGASPMTAAAWNEIVVRNWSEFSKALDEVLDGYRVPPTYVFRGQPNASWRLEPSLLRQIRHVPDRTAARKIEQLLEEEFQAQAALFPETRSVLPLLYNHEITEWWAYMQHHSCPTRMLDWTASAFVGAYFAVSQLPEKDGALFVVGAQALHQYNECHHPDMIPTTTEKLITPDIPDFFLFMWPRLSSSRVVAQQGHFSLGTNLLASHDEMILKACSVIGTEQPGGFFRGRSLFLRSSNLCSYSSCGQ
jgi:hypothetical protein